MSRIAIYCRARSWTSSMALQIGAARLNRKDISDPEISKLQSKL
jgi:hypothetical protein